MRKNEKTQSQEMAFTAHLAEYEAIRTEINLHYSFLNQLINYSIAIIAGVATLTSIAGLNFLSEQPIILLVASLLLSAIEWSFIETQLVANEFSIYTKNVLALKIQKIVSQDDVFELSVIRWDEFAQENYNKYRLRGTIKALTQTGKFLVPLIGSITMIILFYLSHSLQLWTDMEKILFAVSIIAIAIPIIVLPINMVYLLANPPEKNNFKKEEEEDDDDD